MLLTSRLIIVNITEPFKVLQVVVTAAYSKINALSLLFFTWLTVNAPWLAWFWLKCSWLTRDAICFAWFCLMCSRLTRDAIWSAWFWLNHSRLTRDAIWLALL